MSTATLSQSPTSSSVAELNLLAETQQYDRVLHRLREIGIAGEEKIGWLRHQAELGHVPLQYELAVMLFPRDREESFKWYARARLARTLDAAECARGQASLGQRVELDSRSDYVRDAAVADPKAFNHAIEEAFEWDSKRRSLPPANWICGDAIPGVVSGLKRDPERLAARNAAREDMRIAAKTIADFQVAVERGARENVKTVESGILVAPPDVHRWAGWLDNRRLLFVGFPPGTSEIPSPPPLRPRGYGAVVLIWDTELNQVNIFLRSSHVGELCVDGDDVVIVTTNQDETRLVVFEGKYPTVSARYANLGTEVLGFLRADCEEPSPITRRREALDDLPLRNGHGFIERPLEPVLPDGSRPYARFHRADGKTVELPVRAGGARVLAYAPWKSAYLLQGETRQPGVTSLTPYGGRRRGDDAVLFWLYQDGHTDPIIVPYGQWDMKSTASSFYRPTARGLVLGGGYSETDNEPGFAGLYLFEGDRVVTRLIAGPAKVAAVSPSGCRLAFAHTPSAAGLREIVPNPRLTQTMKMIDLCSGK